MDAKTLASSSRKLKFGAAGSTATPASSGMAFPVADLIQTFKPEVWEDFTEEWAHSQEKKYKEVIRYTWRVCPLRSKARNRIVVASGSSVTHLFSRQSVCYRKRDTGAATHHSVEQPTRERPS